MDRLSSAERKKKMNLKSIGYYKEMLQGKETDPSIHDVVKKGDASLVNKICKYLSNGTAVIVCPGVTTDVIANATGAVGTGSSYTDGIWLWPDDLAYYVKKYNIALPDDFLDTMKANGWNNPGTKLDLSEEEIVIDGIEV